MTADWSPDSWRGFEARQQPHYPDAEALAAATRELAAYPVLVDPRDTRRLTAAIADAQAGRAFLLQGGDCAESFAEFSPETIRGMHGLMRRMAERIAAAAGVPVIRLLRLGGQFAKPRSTDPEIRGDAALPAYRGDIVNGIAFDRTARTPDPERMFRAYGQAVATLSHLGRLSADDGVAVYTSHEALLLDFESALVRPDAEPGSPYGGSAHFLWIGDRTRFAGSAHVEFARGITNPIGVKCGPTLAPDALLGLLDTLNPNRDAGRITLISRMGADRVAETLPPLIRVVAGEGHPVLWSCDPMHGNTIKAVNGYKTRPLPRIVAEIEGFFAVAAAEGVRAGGVHVEMTGQDVTECTGGAIPVTEQSLADRYHTHCDPRLNAGQAMEIAELVAGLAARPSAPVSVAGGR